MDEGNFHWPQRSFITMVCLHHVPAHSTHTQTHSQRLHFINITNKHGLFESKRDYFCRGSSQACMHTHKHTHSHALVRAHGLKRVGFQSWSEAVISLSVPILPYLIRRGWQQREQHTAYTTVQGRSEENGTCTQERTARRSSQSNSLLLEVRQRWSNIPGLSSDGLALSFTRSMFFQLTPWSLGPVLVTVAKSGVSVVWRTRRWMRVKLEAMFQT